VNQAMLPVAILAGGLATRLRPVTEKIPKSLVEVNGEPFLAHQLRLLAGQGIERVVLCTGYLGEMVENFAGDGAKFGLKVSYSPDGPTLRGTAGALKNALPLLDEHFLVVYGDSYLPVDYRQAQDEFLKSGKLGLMTVFRNEGKWDTSNVEFRDGEIRAYDKKNRTPDMKYIDYGLGAFHQSAFDYAPSEGSYDLADVYQKLLHEGQLKGLEVNHRFYEIGSFPGIEDFGNYLKEQQ
jgi:NDP-sugar pyrophosphorylase family protein